MGNLFLKEANHFTCSKQESTDTKVGGRILVDYLAGNSFFSDRLYISYATVRLKSNSGEILPSFFHYGTIAIHFEVTIVHAP